MNVKNALIPISLFVMTILSGCQSGEGIVKASINKEFSLATGQTAALKEEQLVVRFDEIQEDSRCPRGATCIWQGRVTAVLNVSDSSDSTKIVLTEPGLSDQYGRITYKNYEFISHVQPYPELGKKITSGDYRLLLTIKKVSPGSD
jgi:hypothetical protein